MICKDKTCAHGGRIQIAGLSVNAMRCQPALEAAHLRQRSRVVLTPDAGFKFAESAGDGSKQPVTGESKKEAVKTIECG